MPRRHPKGATHCIYPESWDDKGWYRLAKSGKHLEVFAIGRGEWFESKLERHKLDHMHKIENPDEMVGE